MTRPRALPLLRIASLVALAVSSALFVDYQHGVPTFCGVGSGCDVVRHSTYANVFGPVPVPVVGMASFAALLWFSLLTSPWAKRITGVGAIAGALGAVAFLSIQAFALHTFCVLCVTVDISAILAGVAGGLLLREHSPRIDPLPPLCWIALAIAAVGLPITYSQAKPPAPVPPAVTALWKPGVVNIVEFSDFECPFCREAHPALMAALKTTREPVNFLRKTMPLPRHPHARDASRAYVCAVRQGKGETMADLLFASNDLSPEGCEASALSAGVEKKSFEECVISDSSARAVDADVQLVMSADFVGLPTIWMGDTALLGAKTSAEYASAITAAARGPKSPLGRWWPLMLLAVTAAGLFALGTRDRSRLTGEATG